MKKSLNDELLTHFVCADGFPMNDNFILEIIITDIRVICVGFAYLCGAQYHFS